MRTDYADYILAGKSKPYTKTSGGVVSEANGVRESLARVKQFEIHMSEGTNDVHIMPPVLLPAGMSGIDFMGAIVHVLRYDNDGESPGYKSGIEQITGSAPWGEAISLHHLNGSFFYDPVTGIFMTQEMYNQLQISEGQMAKELSTLYKAMIGVEETE